MTPEDIWGGVGVSPPIPKSESLPEQERRTNAERKSIAVFTMPPCFVILENNQKKGVRQRLSLLVIPKGGRISTFP